MCGVLYAAEGTAREALEAVAREFSPRIERLGAREIALDLSGLVRLFGDARTMAHALRRTAADRGLRVRVAIAPTRSAARLLARYRAGVTVAEDNIAAVLAPLPISLLAAVANSHNTNARDANGRNANAPNAPNDPNDLLVTLRRWGLRTLGDLAALPSDDVAARLGREGVAWQRLARGEDPRPLVPAVSEERFEQALDLEWPIEGLEPLSFVFGRLMEPLETHLMRRDRGAGVLHVRLHLVDKTMHARSLQLPAPMRDARALRMLALLDLESHPPAAAIDRVVVAVDPTPGRVVQFSLLTRALPAPERLSTLLARLGALVGEKRCGSPAVVDTWQPGAFAMQPFAPKDSAVAHEPRSSTIARGALSSVERRSRGIAEHERDDDLRVFASPRFDEPPVVALRRFRIPVPARVRVEDGRPVRVTIDRRPFVTQGGFSGGRVETAAGPWRTSGNWWATPHQPHAPHPPHSPWDRDEWDVSLSDGATYRVFRERDTDAWFVEGLID